MECKLFSSLYIICGTSAELKICVD